MPGEHAKLSPSDAERWLSCPAAIGMDEKVPPEAESPYAREGSAAHALGEIKASLAFGKITGQQYSRRMAEWNKEFEQYAEDPVVFAEMQEHTDTYVALLKERMDLYPGAIIFLEVRVDTGVPSCWGTSDAIIVSPMHVEAIDFKYGAGVAVEARGNPQLRLYALGALDEYGDLLGTTELIRITVHQPRMSHILTDEMTPDALREWRTDVAIPGALLALSDDAPFGPSDEACRWCPASGRCRAQLEAVFATDFETKPDTLSADEVAEVLGKRKMVSDWLNAFEVTALSMAYSDGIPIPGYKVVLSGGIRQVKDAERFHDTLVEAGYDEAEIMAPAKPKGIGDTEKLLGKERFKELLEDSGIVKKSDGKPALAPESDRRPAIAPNSEAAKVFEAEDLL
jgi:hypothetical protein